MRKLTAAILTAVLLIFGAGTVMSCAADETVFSETKSEIAVSLATDKTAYKAGETVTYTLKIENTRKHYYTAKTNFVTTFTEGLVPVSESSVPETVVKLEAGEYAELVGQVTGDPAVFPVIEEAGSTEQMPSPESSDSTSGKVIALILACAAAVIAVIMIIALITKKSSKKSNNGTKTMALLLVLSMGASCAGALASASNVPASAADYESLTVRPYVKVDYAGTEVMIRMVIELHSYPKRVIIPTDKKNNPKSITCHDPSIFKDSDGTYYLLGTHITGGYSSDLRNWTSIDQSFRASFTQETKDKIREWNDDRGDWWGYLWAPDVVYNPVLGKYCYYLSANGDNWKSNIVMLTSDSITGPYEFAGTVVYGGFTAENIGETDAPLVLGTDEIPERYVTYGVKNKMWGDKWPNCIDPCVFYDDDMNLWMSYGSWSGGIFLLALDENTGLRDYSVTYGNDEHSDEYFGKKIAGGWYVSGEGSYIQKIGDYYWLFISYGGLEAKNGYNIRVFRSKTPDGGYVDMAGNTPYYDKYAFNYSTNKGVRLFGGYKWRTFNQAQVAQGHNSAFVDDDGKAYIVYHTRTTDGTEGHTVKVHQLFLNREEWLVAAPYIADGETLDPAGIPAETFAGDYEILIHDLETSYNNPAACEYITLNADGSISGDYEGVWSMEKDSPYITLEFNGDVYSGVVLNMNIENTTVGVDVFTAVGEKSQITVWGSRSIE